MREGGSATNRAGDPLLTTFPDVSIGGGHLAAKFAECDSALVRRKEVHEASIVAARHAKQLEQRLVAALRLTQTAANELAQSRGA